MSENILGIILGAGKGTRMKSELPKVLHEINGIPMITKCVEAMENAGVEKIVVVVGYKKELIMKELGDRCEYAVQTEQLGTGHAVLSAQEYIKNHHGKVLIAYGDNPLMSSITLEKMYKEIDSKEIGGTLLTLSLENPPQAGRVFRDSDGYFLEVIEEQDCNEEQKKVQEINCGTYCFRSDLLLDALLKLKPNNNQGEYYLTDVPGFLVKDGARVKLVEAEDIFEILGVNDQRHRQFAETAESIRYAESLYELIDAIIETNKSS